jgi:hypothetical protein
VQTLELFAVYALVALTVYLLRGQLASLDDAPLGWRLSAGCAVGAVLAFLPFVQGVDVLPDGLEPLVLGLLVAALVFLLWVSVAVRRG